MGIHTYILLYFQYMYMQDDNSCSIYVCIFILYIYIYNACVQARDFLQGCHLGILSNLTNSHDPHSGTGISSVWGIAGPSSRCAGTSSSSIIIYLEQKLRFCVELQIYQAEEMEEGTLLVVID